MNCRWMSVPFVLVLEVVSAGLLYPNYEGSNPAADFDFNYGNDYYRSVYQVRCVRDSRFVEHCQCGHDDVFNCFRIAALLREHDVYGSNGVIPSCLVPRLPRLHSSHRGRHLRFRVISQFDPNNHLFHQLSRLRTTRNR